MKISTALKLIAIVGIFASLFLVVVGCAALIDYGFGFTWLAMIFFGVAMTCAGMLYVLNIEQRELEEENRARKFDLPKLDLI